MNEREGASDTVPSMDTERLSAFTRRRSLAALLLALVLVSLSGPAVAAPDRPPGLAARLAPAHASDRVIVRYEAGTSSASRARSLSTVDVAAVARISPRVKDTVVVRLEPGQSVAAALVDIGSRPGVAYVEPEYRLAPASTPDDPYYTSGELWGMYGEGTSPSNRYGSGAGEAWALGHIGAQDVYVGIVDEGLQVDHPDLAPNIWTNPWEIVNGVDDDGNGYIDDVHGWDFYNDDATVYDGLGDDHGTHVAGTVGARGGNGRGVAGIDWRVTLIAAKFLGAKGGSTTDAVRAIDYITDLKLRHDLDIVAINGSFSGSGYSQSLADAIDRGGDAGIVFVAAAGNEGVDVDTSPIYPAAHRCDRRADGSARGWDCLIAVANIEADGGLRADSNHGQTAVDLGAPGTDIISTVPSGYASHSGTSMAAPHVTGAVALCASLDRTLSAPQLRARILDSTAPTSSLAGVTVTGGRLDVGALVDGCSPPPTIAATTYLDDLEPSFRRFGSGWQESPSGYAGHHYFVAVSGSQRTAYASWKPVLPAAGSYLVQAWIPGQHATSRKAAYRIRTDDGWATRVRSQSKHRGSWVSLGTHRLTETPIVQLADSTGEAEATGRQLAFDVVRFVALDATVEA